MALAAFTFFATFVLVCSAGLLWFYRPGMAQRLATAVLLSGENGVRSRLSLEGIRASVKGTVAALGKLIPKTPQEISVVQQRLIHAGFREDSDLRLFYGAKVVVPILLCFCLPASGLNQYFGWFGYLLALGLGFLAPDFWLGRRITARQLAIRVGLPDCLDLMVICIEAGLSLDMALSRTVSELSESQPEISDELGLVILEQRAGRPRMDAWRHLAERVDIDIVRTLVSAIIQADQFGTGIARTLRVHSDSLRTLRRQQVEEQAAKMAVKLVFPLVLFIFPSLFVVVLGPAMIIMSESFQKYFQ